MIGVVVYAHGFGVRADARGMFTAISAGLPDYAHELVELNDIDEQGAITVTALDIQAKRLSAAIVRAHEQYQLPVTVIAHSQGCVVTALTHSPHVQRAILLAPPYTISAARIQKRYAAIGISIDEYAMNFIPRRDGTTTRILPEYFTSIRGVEPVQLYNVLAAQTPTTIIIAKDDDVIDNSEITNYQLTPEVIEIPGDHDFTKEYREGLVKQIQEMLS